MPRKCLLNHVVALALIVGLLSLAAPVALAAAPVQDQQETQMGDQSAVAQAMGWFVGVWEKLLAWLPDPGTTSDPPETNESGTGGPPDIGPGIEPNGGS